MRPAALAALAVAGCAALPAAARADQQVVATAPYRFATPTVTIAQGERLTFLNQDVPAHDVTAKAEGPDGRPLFASDLLRQGQAGDVRGATQLTTGEYPFLCSVHPSMEGRLIVSDAGTPAPRTDPSATSGPRAAALRVTAAVPDRRVRSVRAARRLTVRVSVDQPAFVEVAVRLRGSSRSRTLYATTSMAQPGERMLRIGLTRAALRVLRGSRRVRLSISVAATDAAGNRATSRHARLLR